ncbi:MAG: hypothetical protein JWO93_776 [Micrococcaceae bacterium]|jgi:hypothetical protein|nr:hypothetical protein [Micrococcaceae bacterium]
MPKSIHYEWDFDDPRTDMDLLLVLNGSTAYKDFVFTARCETPMGTTKLNWSFSESLGEHYTYSPETDGPAKVRLPRLTSPIGVHKLTVEILAWGAVKKDPLPVFGGCWLSTPFKTSASQQTEATLIQLGERTER